jgi:putative PIN family toxin of toxin-antitoxin system
MPKLRRLRLVLDTNVIISSLIIKNSKPDKVMRMGFGRSFVLLFSPELLDEIERVIQYKKFQQKYSITPEIAADFIIKLNAIGEVIEVNPQMSMPMQSRDLSDDMLLRLAIAGQADYLVTGDKDLLVLHGQVTLKNTTIVTVSQFLQLLEKND